MQQGNSEHCLRYVYCGLGDRPGCDSISFVFSLLLENRCKEWTVAWLDMDCSVMLVPFELGFISACWVLKGVDIEGAGG